VITVLLVEGSGALRHALHVYLTLAADLRLVGEASNDEEAKALAEQLQPDVVVLDAEMHNADAVATADSLRAVSPTTAAVVHALNPDSIAGDGLTRVVGKHEGVGALLEAVRAAARDSRPNSP
jgi:chemotaxis response regulator CheB